MILISWVPTVTLGTMSSSPQEGRGLLGGAARWHRALAFASALEDVPRDGQSSRKKQDGEAAHRVWPPDSTSGLKKTIALGHKVPLSSTGLLWCPGPGEEDMPLPPKFTGPTAQPSILHFPQPSAPRFQGQPLPTAVKRLICERHHASC